MALPEAEKLKQLAGWTPPNGVLSIYVAVEPGDRRAAWRVGLVDRLRGQLGSHADGRSGLPLRAAAERALGGSRNTGRRPGPRPRPASSRWRRSRERCGTSRSCRPEGRRRVRHRPYLRPLVEIADVEPGSGSPPPPATTFGCGVGSGCCPSSTRGRSLPPATGRSARRSDRPIPRGSRAPRQRAATARAARRGPPRALPQGRRRCGPRRSAATRGGATCSCSARTSTCSASPTPSAGARPARPSQERGLRADVADRRAGRRSGPRAQPRARAEARRDREGVGLLGQGARLAGPQETLEALVQGRVDHLLFDAERDYRGRGIEQGLAYGGPAAGVDGPPVAELMIEQALETDAESPPRGGEAAAALDEHDGVVALLRY